MKSTNIIFCVASLLASLGVAILLYPHARLSEADFNAINTPAAMENLELVIDLGDDYGAVTPIELMGFYLENPPQQASAGAAAIAPKRHFGGC